MYCRQTRDDGSFGRSIRGWGTQSGAPLTGTPIENRLLDLWSIFAFAMPGVLCNRAQFVRRFQAKDDPLARRRLAARVRPFLLRRTKQEVEGDLPDRVEEDLLCEMEGEQKTLYSAELKRARQLVLGLKTPEELNEQRFNILTSLLRLRQICCARNAKNTAGHGFILPARQRIAASWSGNFNQLRAARYSCFP